MKNKIFALVFCVLSLQATASNPPQEVIAAFKEGVPQEVKSMFENSKEGYGFKSNDSLKDISYGPIFRKYHMKVIEENNKTQTIEKMMADTNLHPWYFSIVKCRGEPRGIISASFRDGKWKICSYGAEYNTAALFQLFRVYPVDDVVIFSAPYFDQYYFHIIKEGKDNLTQLNKMLPSDFSSKTETSKVKKFMKLANIDTTIERFKDKINTYKSRMPGGGKNVH